MAQGSDENLIQERAKDFSQAIRSPKGEDACQKKTYASESSGDGGGATPVPIPNTEVKSSSVEGTWRAAAWESRTLLVRFFLSGDDGGGATPVPIPNTEVKSSSVEGTWWVAAWESRTLPVNGKNPVLIDWIFYVCAPSMGAIQRVQVPNTP